MCVCFVPIVVKLVFISHLYVLVVRKQLAWRVIILFVLRKVRGFAAHSIARNYIAIQLAVSLQ
jgi:hypothetical protein